MLKFLKNETESATNTSISSFLDLGIFLIGLICNSLSIYVFSRKKMRVIKFNSYLLVLAVFELMFCFILSIDNLFVFFNHKNILLHQVNKYSNIVFDNIVHTIDSYSSIITFILSIDRLYAIWKPMEIKSFITQIHTKLLIFVSLSVIIFIRALLSVLCNLRNLSTIHYCTILTPAFLNFIPAIGILIVNSFLIKEILKSYQNKTGEETVDAQVSFENHVPTGVTLVVVHNNTHHTVSVNRLNQPTKINNKQKSHYLAIIISSFWLLFTTISYYVSNSYYVISSSDLIDFENKPKIKTAQIFFSFLFNSNHCISFFFYFSFYSTFRDYILKIFCKKI